MWTRDFSESGRGVWGCEPNLFFLFFFFPSKSAGRVHGPSGRVRGHVHCIPSVQKICVCVQTKKILARKPLYISKICVCLCLRVVSDVLPHLYSGASHKQWRAFLCCLHPWACVQLNLIKKI